MSGDARTQTSASHAASLRNRPIRRVIIAQVIHCVGGVASAPIGETTVVFDRRTKVRKRTVTASFGRQSDAAPDSFIPGRSACRTDPDCHRRRSYAWPYLSADHDGMTHGGAAMPDPVLVEIAASLAGKAATSLYDMVKAKFGKHPKGTAALEAAQGAAPDSEEVMTLAEELHRAELADPKFGDDLRRLWGSISAEYRADHGSVVNQVTGNVGGTVIQSRDVHGGISFGDRRGGTA